MRKSFALVVLLCTFWGRAAAFDYARYEESSVETLVERAAAFDIHESGQSVLTPPRPVHLRAWVHSYPEPCPDDLPALLMRTVGIAEPPPMKWCMTVKGEKGSLVNVWVQDSFAHFIAEEYRSGEEIELWALWLFVNASDRKPYFVANAIGPAAIASPADGT